MAISASDVKKLRDVTGVGMMDCKKALQEADGDFDVAIDLLRKKGQKVAEKRADRDAKEGLILTRSSDDRKTASLIEINCETDFVARNEDFQAFADTLADLTIPHTPADRDAFVRLTLPDGRSVETALTDMTGKIGEKIDVRQVAVISVTNGELVSYIHPGSRLGVLVHVSGNGDLETAGRDVAMQVAAMNPVAAHRDDVPADVVQREMTIAREAALLDGKPENIVDRIAQGKVERYYKDNVVLEQPFVKDSSQTVQQMLSSKDVSLHGFTRFALGE
ncbi:MAG: elongation factor Ts [Bacteroidetes bacterium CG12_big_fil_rev_8_21_14_0_65_60_17]|nr:MAG: elongation factor Ts [Bacteroidetes bacterium CG12_big_fil_rev_8_21_14_0_65_60_17]